MNLEELIINIFEGVVKIDFDMVIRILITALVIIWLLVVWNVWKDISRRTDNLFFQIACVLLVLFGNILGYFIYLMIRPEEYVGDDFWQDLERRYLLYETRDLQDCEKCEYALEPGFVNCPRCGHDIKKKCPGCEVMIDKNWIFCAYCAHEDKSSATEIHDDMGYSETIESEGEVKLSFADRVGKFVINGISKAFSYPKEAIASRRRVKDIDEFDVEDDQEVSEEMSKQAKKKAKKEAKKLQKKSSKKGKVNNSKSSTGNDNGNEIELDDANSNISEVSDDDLKPSRA